MPDILDRVTKITAESLAKPESEVTPMSRFDELGADSLDIVELMIALEEDFGIGIDDKTIGEVETVGQVVAYLEANLPEAA